MQILQRMLPKKITITLLLTILVVLLLSAFVCSPTTHAASMSSPTKNLTFTWRGSHNYDLYKVNWSRPGYYSGSFDDKHTFFTIRGAHLNTTYDIVVYACDYGFLHIFAKGCEGLTDLKVVTLPRGPVVDFAHSDSCPRKGACITGVYYSV